MHLIIQIPCYNEAETLPEVVACGTTNAAHAIRRPDLGTLQVGAVGEASVFEMLSEPKPLTGSKRSFHKDKARQSRVRASAKGRGRGRTLCGYSL